MDHVQLGVKAVMVALSNCEVHLYREKQLIDIIKVYVPRNPIRPCNENINAMILNNSTITDYRSYKWAEIWQIWQRRLDFGYDISKLVIKK